VPIAGCRLLVDADGKSSVQAKVAQQLLSTYNQKVEDEELPPFCELNEAVTRLRGGGAARLQDLYADVDEAIRTVTSAKGFVTPLPIRLLSEITHFRLFVTHNVISRGSHVPTAFLGELQQRNLLLIGCNFPDWLSRFFLRATRQTRLLSQTEERREWLIEPLGPAESLTVFLRSYSRDTEILSDTPPGEFVAELHRRWMAEHGAGRLQALAGATPPPAARVMFFISSVRRA
jgi:hypothetical protein